MSTAIDWCPGSDSLSDDEIVARVLGGDREIFATFLHRHGQRVQRVALSIVRDSAEAEDVAQDTFVSAFQHLRQFSGRAKFVTWLTRIAVNNALHRLSLRRETPLPDDESDLARVRSLVSTLDPEQHLAASQRARILGQAIAALPEPYRRIVVLRDLQEMDTEATAVQLGITAQNVKVRLHRARRALRRDLTRLVPSVSAQAPAALGPRPIRSSASPSSSNDCLPTQLWPSALRAGRRTGRNLDRRRQDHV